MTISPDTTSLPYDPHPAWAKQAAEVIAAGQQIPLVGYPMDDACCEPFWVARDGFLDAIANTRASTPAGIAEQVHIAMKSQEDDSVPSDFVLPALRNALASLEEMAEGRS